MSALIITMSLSSFSSFKACSFSLSIFLLGVRAVFNTPATFERAVETAAASFTLRKPSSTPQMISTIGRLLGLKAKLKPFSSTAVCVCVNNFELKLCTHFCLMCWWRQTCTDWSLLCPYLNFSNFLSCLFLVLASTLVLELLTCNSSRWKSSSLFCSCVFS